MVVAYNAGTLTETHKVPAEVMACVCTSNTLEGDHFATEGPDACFSVALDPMSRYPHKCRFCLLDGPKIGRC